MRLFTAIDIPDEVSEKLRALTAELMPTAPLAWSTEANWHITTKFVGEFGDGPAIEAALATVRVPAFEVDIRGLGWYPNPHQPRVFFCGGGGAGGVGRPSSADGCGVWPAGGARGGEAVFASFDAGADQDAGSVD